MPVRLFVCRTYFLKYKIRKMWSNVYERLPHSMFISPPPQFLAFLIFTQLSRIQVWRYLFHKIDINIWISSSNSNVSSSISLSLFTIAWRLLATILLDKVALGRWAQCYSCHKRRKKLTNYGKGGYWRKNIVEDEEVNHTERKSISSILEGGIV